MTATVYTDAPTLVATAYRWLHRNDLDMARIYVAKLSDAERVEARMNLLRLAALLATLMPEHIAAAVLTPDCPTLPDGVAGFAINGRTT